MIKLIIIAIFVPSSVDLEYPNIWKNFKIIPPSAINDFTAKVLISILIHIGTVTNKISIPWYLIFLLEMKYANGYPIKKHPNVAIKATKIDLNKAYTNEKFAALKNLR